jgi:hypothetical protein
MRLRLLFTFALLMLAACGGDTPVLSAADRQSGREHQRYAATATVLESREHGSQLCLGGVELSNPPQCGGPDIVGWDWDAIDDEESASGTTWGTYSVIGTWDGERFTITERPKPPSPSSESVPPADLSTPCDPPEGGWTVVDPATATTDAEGDALTYARSQPDFAGAWVDQSINPASDDEPVDEQAMNDPAQLVLNLRFTGELARHEAEVRAVWGGAVCITEARHPLSELQAIQDDLHDELEALSSSVDEVRGVVDVTVVVAEEDLQQTLDARYGDGVVDLHGALQPVD